MAERARKKGPPRDGARELCLVTQSPEGTQKLGYDLAQGLNVSDIVLLRGSLGSGKTTFARGVACGLGIADGSLVSSPSFTLVNIYHGRWPIYHVDLYRLEGDRDFYSIGLDDFLGRDGVTIVEWSDRLGLDLPGAFVVELSDSGEDSRRIRISWPLGRGSKEISSLKEIGLVITSNEKRRTARGR